MIGDDRDLNENKEYDETGAFDMLGMSSSWMAMKGLNIRDSIEKIFGMGFELCELGAAHKYEKNAVETVMELRKKYPDKKFSIHAKFPPDKINKPEGRKNNHNNSHHHTMNIADSKEHEATFKAVKKMFDINDRINAELVGIHGGFAGEVKWVEGYFGLEVLEMKKSIDIETARRNMIIILQELLNMAEERGVKLAIEISPSGDFAPIMVNEEAFEWLFSNFKSKYLGMLLDLGHLHIASVSEGYDPYEFVKKFKNKIFELHLHDKSGDKDHFTVGTGEIDFEKYFKTIGKAKLRKLPMVFEYNNSVTEEQALEGKEMIENLLAKKL